MTDIDDVTPTVTAWTTGRIIEKELPDAATWSDSVCTSRIACGTGRASTT